MIWVNGTLSTEDDAALSVLDHGLTVGDGVFETVKAENGELFALTRHLDRLSRSARGLGLPAPTTTGSARPARPSSPPSRCRSAGCGSPGPAAWPRSAPNAATPTPPWSSPSAPRSAAPTPPP
ncbi:class IV aminotransferase [Kitasatospora cheerisanensis KCTC 2395]|uniref:Class IV aminotransferase n=1 Tax=Kitasatospora cheerisanensis KCTC 2395 TaxID=1348663 RepID=A0A066Z903_9ACTN|nr:class IV aminotransferase [Kitasatospora cheerisanensis KCTC 2395]